MVAGDPAAAGQAGHSPELRIIKNETYGGWLSAATDVSSYYHFELHDQ